MSERPTSKSQNSKDTAGLMWILAIFFSVISSAFFYYTKKDDRLVYKESKLALNLSINFLMVIFAISFVTWILTLIANFLLFIGMLATIGVFLLWVYICYSNYNSVKDNTGRLHIPCAIEFIK